MRETGGKEKEKERGIEREGDREREYSIREFEIKVDYAYKSEYAYKRI